MLDVLLEFLLLVIYPSFRSASAVQRSYVASKPPPARASVALATCNKVNYELVTCNRQGQVGKEQVSSFPTNTTRTWYMVHGTVPPW